MPDQKPTLDYGRPDPPRDLPIDITISVALAAVGLACLLASINWMWGLLSYGSATTADNETAFFGVFLPCLGLLLLSLAWKRFKQRKRY